MGLITLHTAFFLILNMSSYYLWSSLVNMQTEVRIYEKLDIVMSVANKIFRALEPVSTLSKKSYHAEMFLFKLKFDRSIVTIGSDMGRKANQSHMKSGKV